MWQKWLMMRAQTGALENSCFQGMAVPFLCRQTQSSLGNSYLKANQGKLLKPSHMAGTINAHDKEDTAMTEA